MFSSPVPGLATVHIFLALNALCNWIELCRLTYLPSQASLAEPIIGLISFLFFVIYTFSI